MDRKSCCTGGMRRGPLYTFKLCFCVCVCLCVFYAPRLSSLKAWLFPLKPKYRVCALILLNTATVVLGSPPQVFPGASKELLHAPQIHRGCCLLPLSVPTGLWGAWLVLSAPAGTAVLLVTLYGSWIIVF